MVGAALLPKTEAFCCRLKELIDKNVQDLKQIASIFLDIKRELVDSSSFRKELSYSAVSGGDLQKNISSLLDIITASNQAVLFARTRKWSLRAARDTVSVILGLLRILYQLCKDVQVAECTDVHLTSQLAHVFRQGFVLQSNVLILTDSLIQTGTDGMVINGLCDNLCCIANLVQCLDSKALLSIWKTLSRLLTAANQTGQLLEDLPLVLSTLCSNIDEQLRHTLRCEATAFDNSLKLAAFMCKLLINITSTSFHAFSQQKSVSETFLQFLLRFHDHMLQSHTLKETQQIELNSRLFFMVDILIEKLMLEESFANVVLGMSEETKITAQVCVISRVLLHFHTLEADDLERIWLSSSSSIYGTLFLLLPLCGIDLRLRRSAFRTTNTNTPDIFTFVQVAICVSLTCLPQRCFPAFESLLFSQIISPSSRCCRLLAEDCWCFLMRLGSGDLCHSHINLLASLCQEANSSVSRRCRRLLARLSPLLSERHQTDFLKQFSLKSSPLVWKNLPFHRLLPSAREEAAQQILDECSKLIRTDDIDLAAVGRVECCLSALATYLQSSTSRTWIAKEKEELLKWLTNLAATLKENGTFSETLIAVVLRLLRNLISCHLRRDPNAIEVVGILMDELPPSLSSVLLSAAVTKVWHGNAPVSFLHHLASAINARQAVTAATAIKLVTFVARTGQDDRVLDVLAKNEGIQTIFEYVVGISHPLSSQMMSQLLTSGNKEPKMKRRRVDIEKTKEVIEPKEESPSEEELEATVKAVEDCLFKVDKLAKYLHPAHRERLKKTGERLMHLAGLRGESCE